MFSFFRGWKLSSSQLILIVSTYFATVFNFAFYREVFHLQPFVQGEPSSYFVLTIMWFSKTFLEREPFDFNCLRKNAESQSYSHDNLFHTMFSLMDMDFKLSSYKPELDILAQCRK